MRTLGGRPEWISTRELRSRLSDVLVSVTDLEALEELKMAQDVAAYREAKKLAGGQAARARAARPARSSASPCSQMRRASTSPSRRTATRTSCSSGPSSSHAAMMARASAATFASLEVYPAAPSAGISNTHHDPSGYASRWATTS